MVYDKKGKQNDKSNNKNNIKRKKSALLKHVMFMYELYQLN